MIDVKIDSAGFDAHYDVTDTIVDRLRDAGSGDGLVGVFAKGSTVGLTIMRYEPGAVADLFAALRRIAPDTGERYRHELTTGDPNGFSHLRSCVVGTSVLVPWAGGSLAMSDTHRVVLLDFDLTPAQRTLVIDPRPRDAERSQEVLR